MRFFCEAHSTVELFAPPDGRDGRMFTSGAMRFCDTRSRRRAAAPAVRRSGNDWREGGDKGGQPDRPQRVRVPHAPSLCKKPKASCAATTGATPSASDSSDLNDRSAAVPLPKPSMRAWRRAQARRQNPLTRTRAAVDGAPLSRVGVRRRGRHEECVSPLSVTFSVTLHAGPEARPFWQ